MVTVDGGITAFCRTKLQISLLAVMLAICGQVHSASAPGGAVPKNDPWLMNAAQAAPIDIPRASERPLSLAAGPRIEVSSFTVDVDAALSAALPGGLRSQMTELAEQQRQAGPAAGFTIGQMEQIAAEITKLLRDNGFIVAYAFLPTQEVADGRVSIEVLSGALGKVNVEGNKVLSSERIKLPFNTLLGRPLRRGDLESAILNLRDYPGLAPSAVLSPGEEVGTTDLTLRVQEKRFELATMVDNYGTDEIGEGRARLRLDVNNPLKRGDRLTFNVLQTFEPTNGTYGGFGYVTPLGWQGFSMGAFYDENTFDSRFEGFSVDGDSKTGALFAKQKLKRSRNFNMDLMLELAVKESTFENRLASSDPEDSITVGSLYFDLEVVDRFGPLGVNSLTLGFSHGFPDFLGSMDSDGTNGNTFSTRVGRSGERAGGRFDKATLQYQRLQQINESNAVVLRLFGQWSDDVLTSLEQMTLGGAYSVRAYSTAEILADKAIFGSLEYTLNVTSLMKNRPANWDLNFSLFFDHADGVKNDALTNEITAEVLAGFGAGVHYEYRWGGGQGILIRAEVATPTSSHEAFNGDDPQFWLRFEYFNR